MSGVHKNGEGSRPQEAETRTHGALLAGATEAPKSRRRVPGWLTDAVARGFAPAPEKRWPTLAALLAALERGLGRRRRVFLGLAGFVVALTVGGALVVLQPQRSEPCPSPGGLALSQSARTRIELAFRATGATGAEETLARVLPPLEAYVAGWRLRMLESCRATHVNHTQSLELLDRRAACLASRRVHAAGVLETFASADRRIVANAVSVVDGLPALEACDRGDVLLARPPPPAGQGDVVAAIETMLVKGRDLRQRGRFVDALHIFESAASDARKLARNVSTSLRRRRALV